MKKINKETKKGILFSTLILITFYLYYKILFDTNFTIYIKSILFGAFLTFLFYSFILGIVKKTHISNLIVSIIFVILTSASCIKLYYTNDPLLYSDFKYIGDIFEITSIVDNSFLFALGTVFLPIIGYIGLNIFYNIKSFKYKLSINNIKIRLACIIVPLIIFGILLFPTSSLKHFMLKNIYNLEGKKAYDTLTSNLKHYGRYGIFSGMYAHYLENKLDIPNDYNDKSLNKLLNNSYIHNEKKFGTPNIIVIFEESFFNINKISNEIEFDKNVTENFERLKDEGIYFEMLSPSYGGISGNVEFEFLTGANMAYFGNGYVPYMQLYTNKNYYNAPSIIHELNTNGYYTKVSANTGPRLFNCSKFYKYAGFNKDEYIYDIPELGVYIDEKFKKGGKVSDEHVIDEIIKEFDNKDKNKKEFYMTLTMQTHSPYTKNKYEKYDIKIKNSNLNKSMNDAILSYAQGIYDADKQLNRLYEYIKNYDEPTMIVFYGDHLPHITDNKGKSMVDTLKYFNTDNENLNTFRKYNTQALILANFEISENNSKYLSHDMLGTYMLNNMDLELSNYYQWLYQNINNLPALNKYIGLDKEGNIYSINSLPNNLNYYYNIRNSMQYKFFIKDK